MRWGKLTSHYVLGSTARKKQKSRKEKTSLDLFLEEELLHGRADSCVTASPRNSKIDPSMQRVFAHGQDGKLAADQEKAGGRARECGTDRPRKQEKNDERRKRLGRYDSHAY